MKTSKNFFGIRQKLILFFLFLIMMMTAVSYIIYINSSNTANRFRALMYNVVVLNNILNNINTTQYNLEEYLTLKTSETLNKLNASYDNLYRDINSYSLSFSSEEEYLAFKNIKGMIISFGEEVDKAIWASRGRDIGKALVHFNEARKISNCMEENIKFLVLRYLSGSENIYFSLIKDSTRAQTIIILFIIGTAAIMVIYAIVFSRDITGPILDLTQAAKKVSKGEFNINEVNVVGNDEISILTSAFNMMIVNIKKFIDEIKEKANIEKKLQLREMENLKMNNLLRETEFKALQSQINPHFLFNTLSCISQTAVIEGADETYNLLESVSDMLRYNLRRIDKEVTLEDEITNLKRYVFIQKARYRNRVNFELNIQDEKLLKIPIPCLTLQPIVENSFIHGVEKCEKPGKISVDIFENEGSVIIEISDTGVGMNREKIDAILSNDPSDDLNVKGQTTGIGIRNVIKRLRMFYNSHDVIDIESEEGKGTKVILTLPYSEVNRNVQNDYC